MERETRIVTAPNKSWLKARRWYWAVERRNYGVSALGERVYAIWYVVAHGYTRHQPAAEQAARLWLEEEALRIRQQQAKVQKQIDRVQKQSELTTIINVEENNHG